jgi:deoxyribodipyrimidine photo-lyase
MQKKYQTGLMWFRRDLRLHDNAALHHALKSCHQVFCVFVFDSEILDALPTADRRVEFIRESLLELDTELRNLGELHRISDAGLIVEPEMRYHGWPACSMRTPFSPTTTTNHRPQPVMPRSRQVWRSPASDFTASRTR